MTWKAELEGENLPPIPNWHGIPVTHIDRISGRLDYNTVWVFTQIGTMEDVSVGVEQSRRELMALGGKYVDRGLGDSVCDGYVYTLDCWTWEGLA